jgi:hypothetical protein
MCRALARLRIGDDDVQALLGRSPADDEADDAAADDEDVGL